MVLISVRASGLVAIDVARAFAAMSVFSYHFGTGKVLAKHTGLDIAGLLDWPGAVFAVPLFFALSGYCIHSSERSRIAAGEAFSIGAYARRRFWRIYPIYLFALLFAIAVNALQGRPDPAWDIAVHVLMLQGFVAASFNSINLVLWTIAVECFLYALYPHWLLLRIRHGLAVAVTVAVAVTATSWAATAAFGYPYELPARLLFLNTWCGWIAGAVLSEAIEFRRDWLRRPAWWLTGIFAWAVVLLLRQDVGNWGRWQILDAPALILISLWPLCGLIMLEEKLRNAQGVARTVLTLVAAVGAASYSLYLLHIPLVDLRNMLLNDISPGASKAILQAGWFFVVLVICWYSYCFVERPFKRLGSRKHTRIVGSVHP